MTAIPENKKSVVKYMKGTITKDFAEYSQTVSGIFQDNRIQFLSGGRQELWKKNVCQME